MLALLLVLPPPHPLVEDWTPLAPPSLCTSANAAVAPPILASGSHLDATHVDARSPSDAAVPPLTFATFLQIVEDDARARGVRLEVQRQAGVALVRGEASAVAGARALQESLDRAGRALDIELAVRIAPSKAVASESPLAFRRRVRSGDLAYFGTREAHGYVAGFDVEVAAQSGSSRPIVGRAISGRSLHVVASRVNGGERVFVWGVFDVADVVEVVDFDPGTPDLGVLQEPRVVSAQATFAGTVDATGKLTVEIRGTPLAVPDWTLEISAVTTRDSALDAAADAGPFAVLDLGFSASELPQLAPTDPGTLWHGAVRARGADAPAAALPPSAVAALVEAARGPAPRGARPALYWSDRVLLVPRSESAALTEARAIVRGVEAARLSEQRVALSLGALSASLPACAASPARLVVGSEQPLLVGYRLEVAPQIWMPVPLVETAFDGVSFDLAPTVRGIDAAVWASTSGPIVEVARENAQVGKLQLSTRSLKSGTARIESGTSAKLELSGTEGGVATLGCERR